MRITQIRSNDGTGTLTYLLADEENKVAAVIDPNKEDIKNIQICAAEQNVKITHIIDTHTHADHVSGAKALKIIFPDAKIYMHENTKNKKDVLRNAKKFGIEDILNENVKIRLDEFVNDGDIINTGNIELKVIHTPGHTDNHISILAEDALFTGDLLLIGQAGRSDLPGGNAEEQYDSLFNKVLNLPEDTKIYPGHDYEDNEFSYLKDELVNNPFLKDRTKDEYIEFVKDYFPPIAEATGPDGKVSLQCGAKRVIKSPNEFQSINAQQLNEMIRNDEDLFLLDVREPFELMMSGAIEGVVNIPAGELQHKMNEIPDDGSKKIVSICASGNRSYEACHILVKNGFQNVYNLEGGTFGWMQYKKAV